MEDDRKFINEVLDDYFYLYSFEQQEKAFINRVVYGTVEYKIKLDFIIDQFSKLKADKLKRPILYILRMSIYQMLYMDFVPTSAIIDEAVKLTKKRKMNNLSGFVNGVLRTIARNIDSLSYPNLSTLYSVPPWLVEYLLNQYDEETVEKIFKDSLKAPKISIRTNQLKGSKETLINNLNQEKLRVSKGNFLDYALKLEGTGSLNKIKSFQDGLFHIQDESSMLVGEIANPKEEDLVLDLCAAPGGKTTHIAELMNNKGIIYARDISDKKLNLIKENCSRLGITNIIFKKQDAMVVDDSLLNKIDIVLCDLPCSGLGIIKKKPDIKYNITLESIASLIKIQRKILNTASKYVKIGGTLIYSTCTINKAENHENIEWFLEQNQQFELIPLDYNFPNQTRTEQDKGTLQLLPIDEVSDGFFIAKLKRMK